MGRSPYSDSGKQAFLIFSKLSTFPPFSSLSTLERERGAWCMKDFVGDVHEHGVSFSSTSHWSELSPWGQPSLQGSLGKVALCAKTDRK